MILSDWYIVKWAKRSLVLSQS